MTPHLLSSSSFTSLQAVDDCLGKAASCVDQCVEDSGEPTTCDENCDIAVSCLSKCNIKDTCNTEVSDALMSCDDCKCALLFDADSPVTESFALA